ncbi:bifunctional diguanylate cyclase/phosphodiesterase [Frankia sp. AgB32]|nr:bifunctional diguanylate cyclase/phosphodiesterase [Frankia sp. AgB32]
MRRSVMRVDSAGRVPESPPAPHRETGGGPAAPEPGRCRHPAVRPGRSALRRWAGLTALVGTAPLVGCAGRGHLPGVSGVLTGLLTAVLAAAAITSATRAGRRRAAGASAGPVARAVRGPRRHRCAGVDELTGLADRRRFLDTGGRCLAGGGHRVRGAAPVALLLLDLDRMRDINQALGHELGDQLLVTVGRRLRAELPAATVLARVDGDAFAVLLRGAAADRAESLAARLRAVLAEPVVLAAIPVRPDVSVGIAHAPQHGRTSAELLRHAEEAMHAAKRSRAGQAVYAPSPPPVNRARLLLRAEVRQALDRGQIELSYQPKADLRSGRISGVEALVRWRHPVDGMRQPDAFLPEIDRAGLMPKLTMHVLELALADCARWRARGATLTVSVNVPASVIIDRGFVGVVRAALARHRLPSSALVIELTEDTHLEAREAARWTLAGLRRFGVRVSLDDYGTGFCTLTYLRELPADEVKLDRTFLRDLDRDPAAAEIVRSTVSLAHALRLRIVAEGVETQRSWQTLAGWECDEVQGFFVSGPMAGDRVVGWLREWAAPAALPAPTLAMTAPANALPATMAWMPAESVPVGMPVGMVASGTGADDPDARQSPLLGAGRWPTGYRVAADRAAS